MKNFRVEQVQRFLNPLSDSQTTASSPQQGRSGEIGGGVSSLANAYGIHRGTVSEIRLRHELIDRPHGPRAQRVTNDENLDDQPVGIKRVDRFVGTAGGRTFNPMAPLRRPVEGSCPPAGGTRRAGGSDRPDRDSGDKRPPRRDPGRQSGFPRSRTGPAMTFPFGSTMTVLPGSSQSPFSLRYSSLTSRSRCGKVEGIWSA